MKTTTIDLTPKKRGALRRALDTKLGTLYGANEGNCPKDRLKEIRKEIEELKALKKEIRESKPASPAMNESAFFEDNNGGEIIEIHKLENGKFHFQVGWQCVFFMSKVGTISEISEWLAKMTEPAEKAGYVCLEPFV